MKKCKRCLIEKEDLEFTKSKTCKNGIYTYCRLCANEKRKEHYYKNKEYKLAQQKIWRSNNKDYIKQYRKTNNNSKRWHLKKTYGITIEEFEQLS